MAGEQAENGDASTDRVSASGHHRQYHGRLFISSDAGCACRHLPHSLEPDTEFDADPDCPADSCRSKGKCNSTAFTHVKPDRHAHLYLLTDAYTDCLGNQDGHAWTVWPHDHANGDNHTYAHTDPDPDPDV